MQDIRRKSWRRKRRKTRRQRRARSRQSWSRRHRVLVTQM